MSAPSPITTTGYSVVANGLGARTEEGSIVAGISFQADAGDIACIHGAGGTGHTSLALMLCGRMKFKHGTLSVDGRSIPAHRRWLHQNSTFAPTGDYSGLEDNLRIREEVKRTLWLTGSHARWSHQELVDVAGLSGREHELVRDLSAIDRRKFEITCAFVDIVGLVVIDDLCVGVPFARQRELWQFVGERRAESGSTVIVTVTDPEPAADTAQRFVSLDGATA